MKNILLLSVEDEENNICINTYKDAAVLTLTAYLKEKGYNVKIIDEDIKDIDYTDIKKFKPDVIGIHGYIKSLFDKALPEIKKNNPDTYICMGLGQPDLNIKEVLKKYPIIDFAVYNEAELTWCNLLKCLEKNESLEKVKGLIYRKNDTFIVTEPEELIDINTLPYIALNPDHKKRMLNIQTSRGCTNHCSFCTMRSLQRKYRMKDVKRTVDEIEYFVREHKKTKVHFSDYSFEDPNKNRLKALLQEIINRDLNVMLSGNFRPNFIKKIDHELLDLLLKAGFTRAFIGIEAANEQDLILYNKQSTVQDAHRIINTFKWSGINTEIGFINFNPYSTLDSLRQNVDFLDWYGYANFFNIKSTLGMFKETPIYNSIEKDLMTTDDLGKITFKFKNPEVAKIHEFINYYFNYLRNEKIIQDYEKEFNDIKNIYEFSFKLKRKGDIDPSLCALDYYYQIKHMSDAMSHYIASWFKKLLDLADKGFNLEEAKLMSVNILSPDFIRETTEIMRDKRKRFDKTFHLDEEGRI